MSTFMLLGVPLHVQPSVQRGLDALAVHLIHAGYDPLTTSRCLEHVAHEGTTGGLADRGLIRPSDEAAAEEAYVEGLGPVLLPAGDVHESGSHSWDDPGVWTDVESYEDALADTDPEMTRPELAPIRGGAPSLSFSEWLDSQGGIAWEEGKGLA